MEKDLRLVKFPDYDGNVITIVPSYEGDWTDGEAEVFKRCPESTTHFVVHVGDKKVAEVSCLLETIEESVSIQVFFKEKDAMSLVEAISMLRDYCWSKNLVFNVVYTEEDKWFSEFLLRFPTHEIYPDKYDKLYYFTIYK